VPVPENIEQGLGLIRYLYLGFGVCCVFVGLGYYVCRFDPYVGFFRFGGLLPVMIFSIGVLMTGFFIARPFCRFLCPYGALLGLCGSVAAKKVSVTPGDCTKCNLCANVCPYNAILPPTVLPNQVERRQGPQRLLMAIVILPVLMALLGFLGYKAVPKFATLHTSVRTAELLYAEEHKLVDIPGLFPETHAFAQSGGSNNEAYAKALETVKRFRVAGLGFGLWCGLVIGLKLIVLSTRRKRTQYEVDSARCFACGRCFWYCPNQQGERVLLTNA
jgi:NAD-dependent dihydropyrimidine dehydrogenase PreA subunit